MPNPNPQLDLQWTVEALWRAHAALDEAHAHTRATWADRQTAWSLTLVNLRDVPTFDNEDDEAAFWATHELDDESLAQMAAPPDGLLPPARREREDE